MWYNPLKGDDNLTDEQFKLLSYIYRKKRHIFEIYKKFKMDYHVFVNFAGDSALDDYVWINKVSPYEQSTLELTNKGRAYVQNRRRDNRKTRNEWIRYIITTVIAVVALYLSIIATAHQLGAVEAQQALRWLIR
jgi:hypothetical protein